MAHLRLAGLEGGERMSRHRQNFTPAPAAPHAHSALGVALALVCGIAIALLTLHWSLQ